MPTPVVLMRSRYSAYAKGLAAYIVDTTDPDGPQWHPDRGQWMRDILQFSEATRFAGLTILEQSPVVSDRGTVTFSVSLFRDGDDVGFTERSLFRRIDGRWVYVSAEPKS